MFWSGRVSCHKQSNIRSADRPLNAVIMQWPEEEAFLLIWGFFLLIWGLFIDTRKKWRLRRHFCLLRLPMQTSIWIRMAPELNQDVWRGQKNFQTTSFTMTNNISSMKCALKSVPGLTDVGVPHGNGPRAPPRCLEESGKTFKWLILLCLTISHL